VPAVAADQHAIDGLRARGRRLALRAQAAVIARWRDVFAAPKVLLALAALTVALSTLIRLFVGQGDPLWLDEAWTGAIVGQESWAETLRQTYLDVNAPLYYLFMHAWQGIFGLSDFALRAPSILVGIATPPLLMLARTKGLSPADRIVWAAFTGLWIDGLWYSADARCYAFLVLFCALQTSAFANLLTAPNTRRAAIWATWTSLSILTHYQALFLGAVQGVMFLALAPRRAVASWKAGLIFLPMVVWMGVHATRVLQFARPEVAWYDLLRPQDLVWLVQFIFPNLLVLAIPAAGLALILWRAARGQPQQDLASATLWWAGASALIGVSIVIGLGFLRPSFTLRYLTPYAPGLFLLATLLVRSLNPAWSSPNLSASLAARLAALVLALDGGASWALAAYGHTSRPFTYEAASLDMLKAHPDQIVFTWDHPAAQVEDPSQYDAAGGFFFRRAGSKAAITPVLVQPGEDPNLKLLAAAKGPHAAILWLYDMGVHGTQARRFPPKIETLDPRLRCRQYGRGSIGVLGCVQP
jgi:uncharacterized membrane protein